MKSGIYYRGPDWVEVVAHFKCGSYVADGKTVGEALDELAYRMVAETELRLHYGGKTATIDEDREEKRKPPSIAEIHAMKPNITGGMSSEDYIREMR